MLATCQFNIDRGYYETFYDATVAHRLRYRKYAKWIAIALILAVARLYYRLFLSSGFEQHRVLAVVAGLVVAHCTWDAFSHRRRYVRRLVKDLPPDKFAIVRFDEQAFETQTRHSTSRQDFTGLQDVIPTPAGLILAFEHKMSIFVPRSSFESAESYESVIDTIAEARD